MKFNKLFSVLALVSVLSFFSCEKSEESQITLKNTAWKFAHVDNLNGEISDASAAIELRILNESEYTLIIEGVESKGNLCLQGTKQIHFMDIDYRTAVEGSVTSEVLEILSGASHYDQYGNTLHITDKSRSIKFQAKN